MVVAPASAAPEHPDLGPGAFCTRRSVFLNVVRLSLKARKGRRKRARPLEESGSLKHFIKPVCVWFHSSRRAAGSWCVCSCHKPLSRLRD